MPRLLVEHMGHPDRMRTALCGKKTTKNREFHRPIVWPGVLHHRRRGRCVRRRVLHYGSPCDDMKWCRRCAQALTYWEKS